MKHLPKLPLQVNFFIQRHLACSAFYQSYLSTPHRNRDISCLPPALLFHWFLENRKQVSFTPFLEFFVSEFQLNCQLHEFLVSLFREDLYNENEY
jgi:hypothetical protein